MSAQLKWRRFAGGSTLVVIIPEFIRALHKRSTIYSFTLEQGSHKNARTGSPEAPELKRVKSHSQVVSVYMKLSHRSFITSKCTVILCVFFK